MRTMSIVTAVALISSLTSCGGLHRLPQTEVRDSVVTVIRDSIVWRDSVVLVELPMEGYAVETHDDSSHLETTLASSDAVVRGGFLKHTLENKARRYEVPIQVPERYVVTEATANSRQVIRQVVEVERALTWWQETKMRCGVIAIAMAAAAVLWLVMKTAVRMKMNHDAGI